MPRSLTWTRAIGSSDFYMGACPSLFLSSLTVRNDIFKLHYWPCHSAVQNPCLSIKTKIFIAVTMLLRHILFFRPLHDHIVIPFCTWHPACHGKSWFLITCLCDSETCLCPHQTVSPWGRNHTCMVCHRVPRTYHSAQHIIMKTSFFQVTYNYLFSQPELVFYFSLYWDLRCVKTQIRNRFIFNNFHMIFRCFTCLSS